MTEEAPRDAADAPEPPGHQVLPAGGVRQPSAVADVAPIEQPTEARHDSSVVGARSDRPEDPPATLPIDPDVEPQDRVEPLRLAHLLQPLRQVVVHRWDVLALISLGGALGSLARWGTSIAWGSGDTGFPWATLQVNVLGSALLGLLMVLVHRRHTESRYLRPFLAVGVLGGFTTFSTYALDVHDLVLAHRSGLAGLYLVGSTVVGLLAVWLGVAVGRVVVGRVVVGGATRGRVVTGSATMGGSVAGGSVAGGSVAGGSVAGGSVAGGSVEDPGVRTSR